MDTYYHPADLGKFAEMGGFQARSAVRRSRADLLTEY
jgi:hypothetical protein